MGDRAKELFPFKGEMRSAYYIAKSYGVQGSVKQVREKLRVGATPEEAVAGLGMRAPYRKKTVQVKPEPKTRIEMQWVEELKKKIKKGQWYKLMVEFSDNESHSGRSKRVEKCVVTGVYPHLVTFLRPCGLATSKTYVELLMEGVVR